MHHEACVPFVHAGEQACILLMDMCRVHIRKEFCEWLYKTYPFVHMILVPAGCTGIAQVGEALQVAVKTYTAMRSFFWRASAGRKANMCVPFLTFRSQISL
jgi:hypothetical protein